MTAEIFMDMPGDLKMPTIGLGTGSVSIFTVKIDILVLIFTA